MFDKKMLKAMIACCIGLLLKFVGVSPVDGVAMRYTFNLAALENGFQLIVVIISVFAIPEMISIFAEPMRGWGRTEVGLSRVGPMRERR